MLEGLKIIYSLYSALVQNKTASVPDLAPNSPNYTPDNSTRRVFPDDSNYSSNQSEGIYHST